MTYEVTDPTVDCQVIQLKDSGANVFFNIAIPKFAAQAMRKAADIGWKPGAVPQQRVGVRCRSTMKPAGFENVQGVITAAVPQGSDRQAVGRRCRDEDVAGVDGQVQSRRQPAATSNYVYAYSVSFLMQQTLKKCGDNLTHENLMRQAANIQKLRVPVLLPGITVSTSPTDYYPIQAVQLAALQGRDLGPVRRRSCTPKAAKAAGGSRAATLW